MAWTKDWIDPETGRRHRGQITIVQMYRRWAKVNENEYRELLDKCTGCRSSTHPSLTNFQFDKFMACLEGRLDRAIQEGETELPRGVVIDYYRRRWVRYKLGLANSRIIHEVRDWWFKLKAYLPPADREPEYCRAIISRACGGMPIKSLEDLTKNQALLAIDVLRMRLNQELRRHPELPESGYEPVPTTSADIPSQDFAADQPDPDAVPVDSLQPEEDVPF